MRIVPSWVAPSALQSRASSILLELPRRGLNPLQAEDLRCVTL